MFHLSHHNPALLQHPPKKNVWAKKGRKETLAANASALLSKGFISDSADSKPQKWRLSPQTPPGIVGKSWDIVVFPRVWNSDTQGPMKPVQTKGILEWLSGMNFYKNHRFFKNWMADRKMTPNNKCHKWCRKQKGILLVDAAVIFRLSLVDGVLFVCCLKCVASVSDAKWL